MNNENERPENLITPVKQIQRSDRIIYLPKIDRKRKVVTQMKKKRKLVFIG